MPGSCPELGAFCGGGIQSSVHAVDLVGPGGRRLALVVKRYAAHYLDLKPDALEIEHAALRIASRSTVPTPRVVWTDPAGEIFGTPALVMTRLPGETLMHVLARQSETDTAWIAPVAGALVAVHGTPLEPEDSHALRVVTLDGLLEETLTQPSQEIEQRERSLPAGSRIREILQAARSRPGEEPAVLIHGDFHAGNLLGTQDTVTGVIDWSEARLGSRGYDLAHLRWETILRYGLELMDLLQEAYERAAATGVPDISLWDLLFIWRLGDAIRSWIWFYEIEGRPPITLPELEERRALFIEQALARLS